MLNHAHMLMRKPFDDREFAAADGKLDGKGDLFHLFRVLRELEPDARPPITLIGHSMGAIVVNHILRNFPDLPYRNVVFMGAAASVRDTIAALDVVMRTDPDAGLRFYNLSLHQEAEANEVGYFGTVSKGSLLEWVDRMYTTPATFRRPHGGQMDLRSDGARRLRRPGPARPAAVVQALRPVLRRAPDAHRVRRVRAAPRLPLRAPALLGPGVLDRVADPGRS
jgi:pimeloyl-ACP methyl ester carboxylesterase